MFLHLLFVIIHQCESIPRRARADNNNSHCHGHDHDHDLTNTKGGSSAHLSSIQFTNRLFVSKNQELLTLNNNCFQRLNVVSTLTFFKKTMRTFLKSPTDFNINSKIYHVLQEELMILKRKMSRIN